MRPRVRVAVSAPPKDEAGAPAGKDGRACPAPPRSWVHSPCLVFAGQTKWNIMAEVDGKGAAVVLSH